MSPVRNTPNGVRQESASGEHPNTKVSNGVSRIVFDVGGSRLRVALANGSALSAIEKVDTPPAPDTALAALLELIKRVSSGETIETIVGGVAGVIGADGTVLSSPNLPYWEGYALAEKLRAHFSAHVTVANDVELAGLGEALFGAGRDAAVVGYLSIGTGVGGARIVAGALDRRAVGFEPGHQIIEVTRGATLESLIGGAALTHTHGTPPETLPRAVWDGLTPVLAAGVWNAIVHWSPDVVVLGGSLMNETTAFRLADVARAVETYRRVIPAVPPLRRGALGDAAGLHGALALPKPRV